MDESGDLSQLAPFVAPLVNTLRQSKIGIMSGEVRISDIATGCAATSDGHRRCSDRFKLQLSYAGQSLRWETIFNYNHPSEPPDFIFLSEENGFRPDISELKTLYDWNATDKTSLLRVIYELLENYKRYHLSLLGNSRLLYDYNMLMDSTMYTWLPEDIEVFVTRKNGSSCGPVLFMFRLRVDISAIPEYLHKGVLTETGALLVVTYQTVDGGRVTPRLQLARHLEHLVVDHGIRLTSLLFPADGHLVDYVHTVRLELQKVVETIVNVCKLKEEFISAFLNLFGSSVIEYNTTDFSRISFVFVWNDFTFLIVINLPKRFPQDQPAISFQSIYHLKMDGTRYSITVNDYPYSPRWTGAEMARRTRNYIQEKVQEFQRLSVREGVVSF